MVVCEVRAGGLGAQVGGCYMEDIPPNKGREVDMLLNRVFV